MNKKRLNNTHLSLSVIFSLFILVMSSIVFVNIIKDDGSKKYENIDSINPILIDSAYKKLDKTSHNVELASEIKRVYDIDILYGEGTEYLAKSVSAKPIYDQEKINNMLMNLINCLEKYPSNIFKEIELKDYTVEVCMVENFTNDNIALATRDSNNNFRIYLSNSNTDKKTMRAIHHEAYHILEYYMKLEYDINELYKDWNKYNPDNFKYAENILNINTDYVYGFDKLNGAYFVSLYSKVSEKEDRAEVFADTMIANEIPEYYFDNVGAIKSKVNLICSAIDTCFYSVNDTKGIYWSRYFNY